MRFLRRRSIHKPSSFACPYSHSQLDDNDAFSIYVEVPRLLNHCRSLRRDDNDHVIKKVIMSEQRAAHVRGEHGCHLALFEGFPCGLVRQSGLPLRYVRSELGGGNRSGVIEGANRGTRETHTTSSTRFTSPQMRCRNMFLRLRSRRRFRITSRQQ